MVLCPELEIRDGPRALSVGDHDDKRRESARKSEKSEHKVDKFQLLARPLCRIPFLSVHSDVGGITGCHRSLLDGQNWLQFPNSFKFRSTAERFERDSE